MARGQRLMCNPRHPRNIDPFVWVPDREDWCDRGDRREFYVLSFMYRLFSLFGQDLESIHTRDQTFRSFRGLSYVVAVRFTKITGR